MGRRSGKKNQVTAAVVVSNEHPTPADIEAALHESIKKSVYKFIKRTCYDTCWNKKRRSPYQ